MRVQRLRCTSATVAAIAAAATVHVALLEILADGSVVSKLLSPGPHSPVFELLVAVGFLAVRLFVIVLAPSMMLAAGVFAMARSWRGRRGRP